MNASEPDLDIWDNLDDPGDMHVVMSDDEFTIHEDSENDTEPLKDVSHEELAEHPEMEVEEGIDEGEPDTRDEALQCIEDLVLSFLAQLSEALPDTYSQSDARKGRGKKIVVQIADRTKEPSGDETPMRTLVFPKHSKGLSARPVAQLFRVVDLMHEALSDDVPTTKRDMYYKDVQLFRSQATVDKLVDDLAATFQLSRADLNVRASSKGLMCGFGLKVHLKSGDVLQTCDNEVECPICMPITGFRF